MPVNRWAPAAGVIALCLGLVLIIGVGPAASPAAILPSPIAVETTPPTSSPTASLSTTPDATPTPPIPAGYRVKIPRLGIDLPIAEGDLERDSVRQETPEGYAFHYPRTAIPGEGGNAYLYAHARRGMFLALWNARKGDTVWIVTPDGRELRYVVSEVHPRVEPTDISWLAPASRERLTLQTSTGPHPADPRFVVVAVPV
jgi:LPXTG-site transpeptidase (sortase) family protein